MSNYLNNRLESNNDVCFRFVHWSDLFSFARILQLLDNAMDNTTVQMIVSWEWNCQPEQNSKQRRLEEMSFNLYLSQLTQTPFSNRFMQSDKNTVESSPILYPK